MCKSREVAARANSNKETTIFEFKINACLQLMAIKLSFQNYFAINLLLKYTYQNNLPAISVCSSKENES